MTGFLPLRAVVGNGDPRFAAQRVADVPRAAPVDVVAAERGGADRGFQISRGIALGRNVDRGKRGILGVGSGYKRARQRESKR